ncbi:hypothetical protein OFN42_42270, partial [Escherichia coli]|nr:hypothetical protein [Escherichia coli]
FCELFEKNTSIVDVCESVNLALVAKKGFDSVAVGNVAGKNENNATTLIVYSERTDFPFVIEVAFWPTVRIYSLNAVGAHL